MVRLAGATPVTVETSLEHNYKMTPEQLLGAITPATKMLVLNSPSNPSGAVYSEAEIRGLMKVLEGREIFVISDEMYDMIVYGGGRPFSPARVESMKDWVIVSNGVSKTYAMTGWRIGYLAGPKWIIDACDKIQSQTTSNPNAIAQKAAVAALTGDQSIVEERRAEFEKRRDFMFRELNSIPGIEAILPEGAFLYFPLYQRSDWQNFWRKGHEGFCRCGRIPSQGAFCCHRSGRCFRSPRESSALLCGIAYLSPGGGQSHQNSLFIRPRS